MIKARFISREYGAIVIPFARAYLYNSDYNTFTYSSNKNNRIALYEKPIPIETLIKDYPSYLDFTSDDEVKTREYLYEHNPNLKLRIRFYRYDKNVVKNTGVAGVQMLVSFIYVPYNWQYTVGCVGHRPVENRPMIGGSIYSGGIALAYDMDKRMVLPVYGTEFIIKKLKGTQVTTDYGTSETISGELIYPTKGEYSYTPPTTKSSYTTEDIGSSIEISPIYNPNHEYYEGGGKVPTILTILAKEKDTYPDGDDDPEFPDGDGDDDSDDIDPNPIFPTTPTGFVTMYNPNTSQLNSLASFMWSKDFVDVFLKLMQNPYEAIISLKTVCCDIATGGSQNIILGNVDTKISCAKITQQYQQVDCGTINLTRYFGNFLDFNPYTSIKIYLPFVGFRELDVDEVMGASLHLYYNIDLLTGSCVALINVRKKIGGTDLNSVLYQFDGMIANDIPITAADYSQVVSAVIKGVASVGASIGIAAATGGTGAPASGAILGSAVASETTTAVGTAVAVNSAIDMVSSKITVQHGGNLSGSMGALATKKPYIIIQRVIPKNPTNYAKLHGIPSNAYKKLSSLKGFTKMQDIQIKSTIGSVDETEEIKQLLLGGVVI